MATTCKLIAKQTLGSNASTVTFSDIPGTYTDLVVVCTHRTTATGNASSIALDMSINGVTTNRSGRRVGSFNGSTVYSDSITTAAVALCPGSSVTADTFGNTQIYIPNYAGSTNKSFSVDDVTESNSSTDNSIAPMAGLWSSTAAITELGFSARSGNLRSGSSFFLYGITKA